MKKTALSIFFMLVFSAYSFFEPANRPSFIASNIPVSEEPSETTVAAYGPDNASVPVVQDILSALPVSRGRGGFEDDEYDEGEDDGYRNTARSIPTQTHPSPAAQPAQLPAQSNPQPVAQASAVAATNKIYKNGIFTGASIDAYYGNVQVKVTTKNDRIVDVQFLDYPRDRNTSVSISSYATPILRSEAIKIQGAQVDTVSGATATSGAFRDSLASALALAKI